MPRISSLVRVARTSLGRGVFARRRIRRNQIVGEVLGRVIDDPDYGSDYCMELGSGRTLEPRAPFRYLNHRCEPNCQIFIWDDPHDPTAADRMWVQALRPIRPGEELTIDYAWAADSAIRCLCGSPKCRGWIVSLEELSQVVQVEAVELAVQP